MHLWTRELVGWALLALGLYVFARAFGLMTDGNHFIAEGGALTFMGVILFRGGIHLLKIAVAARICETTAPRAVAPVEARGMAARARREAAR